MTMQVHVAVMGRSVEPNEFLDPDFINKKDEAALTAYFKHLIKLMETKVGEQNAEYARVGESEKFIPQRICKLSDHQTNRIPGAGHKMDLAFIYSGKSAHIDNVHVVVEAKREEITGDIGEKTFKQIADYQYSIWNAQRTRTFVPVLFLHGARLDLIAFTRSCSYRIELGPICYRLDEEVFGDDVDAVRLTMAWLYYFLALPPESFGHFCDVKKGQRYLRFVRHSDDSTVLATAESVPVPTVDSVSL
ncbi:hypothetical protein GGI20_006259, partial [Coemansia sp. BCRC 34301]